MEFYIWFKIFSFAIGNIYFNLKDKNVSIWLSSQNGIYRMKAILLDCKVRSLREKFKMLIQFFIGLEIQCSYPHL